MRRAIGALVVLVCALSAFSQDNISGYGDTSFIANFGADSLKYSKWFDISAYENKRVTVLANDTGTAGFKNDSVKFYYWLETANVGYTPAGKRDTVIDYGPVIDTFDMLTAGNYTRTLRATDSLGGYARQMKYIDTTRANVGPYQTRDITMPWNKIARIGFKGLTGNRVLKKVWLRVDLKQRQYISVRNQ